MPELSTRKLELKPRSLNLTENAIKVLEARYLKKNEKSEVIEASEDLFWRVAKSIAAVEKDAPGITENDVRELEIKFFNLMAEGFFMPNSPTLMNAGREMGMLSACFVLPVEDSIDGIFTSIKNTALIQKAGGGTGFNFSRLRPRGDLVRSSGGSTSGPLSFLRVFSEATEAIQQGAFRRGANMGIMNIDHPDIVEFINIKRNLNLLTNFNLSIAITNEFMEELKKNPDKPHLVSNPRSGEKAPLPKKDSSEQHWTVGELFDLIIDRAWESGEPGVIFIDRINEDNPTPQLGKIEGTNPCGEQPLLPYEACNLGSINLSKFVRINEKGDRSYDYEELKEVIHTSMRFLDDVVDANNYPLPEIKSMCMGNRKVGLGVMGFADALYLLRTPYTSEEGIRFAEDVMKFVQEESHNASEAIAEIKGVFPNWEGSVWDTKYHRKMRNAATTTVAPTGTISIIADCSSGIEPLFSLSFFRNVLNGQKLAEVNRVFKLYAQEKRFYSDDLAKKLAEGVSLQSMECVDEQTKKVFVTAHDIEPSYHIRMQAAFQRYCDSSISKTINFPHSATKEEVEQIYRMAYDYRVKGVTVYRDGCRQNQPMAHEKKKEEKTLAIQEYAEPVKLPEIMSCLRIRQKTPFGNMHVKISVEPKSGKEYEVFAQLGKGGDVANSDLEAICRMLSLFLRCHGSLAHALNQLDGIGSSLSVPSKDGRVMSLADGLAKAITKYVKAKQTYGIKNLLLGEFGEETAEEKKTAVAPKAAAHSHSGNGNGNNLVMFKIKCPECNSNLSFEEGCIKCHSCGYSQC